MKRNQSVHKREKQCKRYILSTAVITSVVAVAFVISLLLSEKPNAVIIDQLGGIYPNPTLVKNITKKFNQAGVKVDYIPSEQVTVDFYRLLPTKGYKYIVLRAHTSLFRVDPSPDFGDELAISTNEPYTTSKYWDEQGQGKLAWLSIPAENTRNFGVSSRFVESSMEGSFNDATFIMMGCNGLTFSRMAKALVEKGAGSVIGWDEMVSLDHTDNATELLVSEIVKGQTELKEIVEEVMAKVGEDPNYRSRLAVYPNER